MNTFDYLSSFNNNRHTDLNIIREIDSLLSTEDIDVRFIPFGCQQESIDWINSISVKDRQVVLQWKSNRLSLYLLNYKYKENGKEIIANGKFFVLRDSEYSDSYVAITIESSKFYRRALLPFIQSLYPKLLLTFITHKKMRRLLEQFIQKDESYNIIITRASQRLRFQEDPKGRHVMPMVSWPSMSLEDSFQWVYDHNGWFESLSFDVKVNNQLISGISFSRRGLIKANGLIEEVYQSFIKPVTKTLHENIEFFSHRSRLDRPDLSPRPIVVQFDDDQFADIGENQRFISSLRRMNSASISVLHGNPYLHVSILDYLDGSAFDLWILEQQKLVIVPQLQVSVAAIKRLINHIYDNYAEGNLGNYQEGY
jgi:hypothetical protein